ncbi:hypothetical protein [Sphingomonas sp. Leaf242]|nr:hypothetical protein [Sphingomonas sp. Leaf242]
MTIEAADRPDEGLVETMPYRLARPIWALTNPALMSADTLRGVGPLNPAR